MLRLVEYVLYALVFSSALWVVIAQHDARRFFVELQALAEERDALDEQWVRLQLEQSTWASDDRIEAVARRELNMRSPEQGAVVLLAK